MVDLTDHEALMRLKQIVDIHGADPARWPPGTEALITQSGPEGQRLLAEARALDELLAFAPDGGGEERMSALEARIFATARNAQAQADSKARKGGVKAQASTTRRRHGGQLWSGVRSAWESATSAAYGAAASAPITVQAHFRTWGAAALLTASLALGIYLGASGVAAPTWQGAVALAANSDDAIFVGFNFGLDGFDESKERL